MTSDLSVSSFQVTTLWPNPNTQQQQENAIKL